MRMAKASPILRTCDKVASCAFHENYRQKIERWNIGVADFWNVPAIAK